MDQGDLLYKYYLIKLHTFNPELMTTADIRRITIFDNVFAKLIKIPDGLTACPVLSNCNIAMATGIKLHIRELSIMG